VGGKHAGIRTGGFYFVCTKKGEPCGRCGSVHRTGKDRKKKLDKPNMGVVRRWKPWGKKKRSWGHGDAWKA